MLPAVPIAHFSGPCAGSPMNVQDSFPSSHNVRADVVGIAKIVHRGIVVGWIYRTQKGAYFVQAMPNMPLRDQQAAGIEPARFDPNFKRLSNRETPRLYSSITPLSRWPWRDLQMEPCGRADIVPWLQKAR